MCSEKVSKSQVDPIDFRAPLIFEQQNARKLVAQNRSFFMHFEATKQVLEERI